VNPVRRIVPINPLSAFRLGWIFRIVNNLGVDHLRQRLPETLSLDGSPHADTPRGVQATALQIAAQSPTPTPAPRPALYASSLACGSSADIGGDGKSAPECLSPCTTTRASAAIS